MNTPPPSPSSAPVLFGFDPPISPAWASFLVAVVVATITLLNYQKGQREKREAQARLVWVTLGDVEMSDENGLLDQRGAPGEWQRQEDDFKAEYGGGHNYSVVLAGHFGCRSLCTMGVRNSCCGGRMRCTAVRGCEIPLV